VAPSAMLTPELIVRASSVGEGRRSQT